MTTSTDLENARRRVSARWMRRIFHAGVQVDARLPRTGIHRILVCRNVHTLGDSLTLTPLLTELARVYPGAEVDIISRCAVAEALYGTFPNVRHLHRLPKHIPGHLLATAATLRNVRCKHYDLVIDPDPQSQSGRLLALSAHATFSLGYVGPNKSGTLTHGVAVPNDVRNKAMTPVYLLRQALGEDPAARAFPQPSIGLSHSELTCGRRFLTQLCAAKPQSSGAGPSIAIFANATRDKLLTHAWWQPFIAALEQTIPGCRIVEILPAFGHSLLDDRFPCFYSSNVRKIAAVIANTDAYISADCGVMHLAWAAGTPTVGLFNVTDPDEWGPFGAHACALHVGADPPAATAREAAQRLGLLQPEASGSTGCTRSG